MLQLLLEAGVDPNEEFDGATPLEYAEKRNRAGGRAKAVSNDHLQLFRSRQTMHIEVPPYQPARGGFDILWEESFSIAVSSQSDGSVVIRGDAGGFVSLARMLPTLGEPEVPSGTHVRLDASNSLEEGSVALLIERS